MKLKHTPGPWKRTQRVESIISEGVVINPEDGSGAIGFVLGGNSDECKANAKLVACAPELLNALIIISNSSPNANKQGMIWLSELRALQVLANTVITKATNWKIS